MEQSVGSAVFACSDFRSALSASNSTGLSSPIDAPFRFRAEAPRRPTENVYARRSIWPANAHTRFCALGVGGGEFDAATTLSPVLAFNARLSVSLLRLSNGCDEGSFFRLRSMAGDGVPSDYFSAMAFDRDGAPLIALAKRAGAVEIDDINKQRTFVRLPARGVVSLALARGLLVAAAPGPSANIYSLREDSKPVATLGTPSNAYNELILRTDSFDNLLSLDTQSRTLCFDLRNCFRPLIDQPNDFGQTFLGRAPLRVGALSDVVERLFEERRVELGARVVDAAFDRRTETVAVLCRGADGDRVRTFDAALRVRTDRPLPSDDFRKCALVGEGFFAAVGRKAVALFELEGEERFVKI